MKAIILAGVLGLRSSEETHLKPKPMIEIGGMPILWHIKKIYSNHSINDFIICCGYKGYVIKEYFDNYFMHMSDITFDLSNNHMKVPQLKAEPWKVTSIDTGTDTMNGVYLKRENWTLNFRQAFKWDTTSRCGQAMSETKKCKSYLPEFKSTAVLEAPRGVNTGNQIAQDYGVQPVQVGRWNGEIKGFAKTLF